MLYNVLQKRQVLEESNQLDPRMSALDENIEDAESEEEEEEKGVSTGTSLFTFEIARFFKHLLCVVVGANCWYCVCVAAGGQSVQ